MPKPAALLDSPPERANMNSDTWRGRLAGMPIATQTDLLLDLLDAELTRAVGTTHGDGGARDNRHAPWRRLGVYRHTADRLHEGLTRAVGLRLPATVFFDQPTPASLVAYLLRELLGIDEQTHAPSAQGLTTAAGADSIAIVGMACRLPGGVDSPEALWAMVSEGREALGGLPDDRGWDLAGLYDPDPDNPGTSYTRNGGFLPGIDRFDAGFFGISPREAGAVDPQQRLMLEISWEALERAGLDARTLRGSRTGVFTGVSLQDYGPPWAQAPHDMQGQMLTGNASGIIAGRVSYTFGFEGPALCVDTQCSASLVAVHLAGQSLRTGECDLALAGGVTVMSSPGMLTEFSRKRGLAADGRCKAFGAGADGTGWADGATVLLLERLSDARRNNHPVLAVVRGSAVNADGATNGMTAPNGTSQQRLIRQALANAGLRAADVDAVEAHGTGTVLGDPIEAQAIQATYGRSRPPQRPLYLGSLKSNLGHAMAAAGVAGVIKSVQALIGEMLPATLHVEEPTPHVDWSDDAVHLLTDPVPWPRQAGRTRRIAVSAFGISGTNAHLIIEEAPHGPLDQLPRPRPASPESTATDSMATQLAIDTASADLSPPDLDVLPRDTFSFEAAAPLPVVLSGRTAGALRAAAGRLGEHLAATVGLDLADMAYSLAGRSRFEHRATIVVGAEAPHERLAKALSALAAGRAARGLTQGTVRAAVAERRLALLFTGQGSQRPGMGRDLYETYPVFADALDEVCTRFDAHLDRPLRRVMFAAAPADAEALGRTEYTQPALFAFETALFRLVTAWGLDPGLLAGHSIGELVAAHVAGVWSLEDAVTMVSARGRLMQSCRSGGAMISIRAGAEAVAASLAGLAGQVEIATVNGPEATVIAGDADLAERVAAGWQERGVATRRLTVSHAFHSPHMDDMLAEFREVAAGVDYQEPTIPIVSTLTGRLDPAELTTPEHWVRHVRQPVRFDAGARGLRAAGAGAYLELGPDAVLTALLPACLATGDTTGDTTDDTTDDAAGHAAGDAAGTTAAPATAPDGGNRTGGEPVAAAATRGRRPEAEALLGALAELDVHGVAVDWRAAGAGVGRLVELPTYPFQRRRHWLDPAVTIPAPRGAGRAGAGGASDPASWRYRTVWRALPDAAATEAVTAQAAFPPPLSGRWPLLVPTTGLDEATLTRLSWLIARLGGEPVAIRLDGADADRARIAAVLAGASPDPDVPIGAVVSLLGLDTSAHPVHPALSTGFALTVALAQALGDADVTAPLWLITRGAVSTGPQDPVTSPEQAMLWGLGRTLALERPGGFGGLLDLPAELDDESLGWFGAALTTPGGEDQSAARTAHLFVPRLVRVDDADPASTGDAGAVGSADTWRPGATVLITGGTGALGARTARHLATRGAEHLVLTGRRGRAAPGVAELEAELAALGAKVTITSCDCADADALAELLGSLAAAGTPVTTVVHAAGVAGPRAALAELDLEQIAAVVAGKAGGAATLDALLPADTDLVLFSSISAVWGSGNQAAYSAANAYLDALAEHRRGAGRPTTAVAFGPWAETGMGADPQLRDYLTRRGLRPLAAGPALRALTDAVSADEARMVVVDVDWDRFLPALTAARPSHLFDDLPPSAPAGVDVAASGGAATADIDDTGDAGEQAAAAVDYASLPAAERASALVELVRSQAAGILGHDSPADIDPDRRFLELGFDSLASVQLSRRLAAATALPLGPPVVFEHPTVHDLAAHLDTLVVETGPRAALSVSAGPVPDLMGAGGGLAAPLMVPGQQLAALMGGLGGPQLALGAPAVGGVRELYRQACEDGKFRRGMELLRAAARLRPVFTEVGEYTGRTTPIQLAAGPAGTAVVCVPAMVAPAGPHNFARLALHLHGQRDVYGLSLPGFDDGEPLPASADLAVDLLADTVQRHFGDRSVALAGYSSGGWLAHAVATRIEQRGGRPTAVLLLDTWFPEDRIRRNDIDEELRGIAVNEQAFALMTEAQVTGQGGYLDLFEHWRPGPLDAPVALFRAVERMPEEPEYERDADADAEPAGPEWDFAFESVDVAGDHQTMMNEFAASTSTAVHDWLRGSDPR